jgi:hypothetical protein
MIFDLARLLIQADDSFSSLPALAEKSGTVFHRKKYRPSAEHRAQQARSQEAQPISALCHFSSSSEAPAVPQRERFPSAAARKKLNGAVPGPVKVYDTGTDITSRIRRNPG